MAKSNALENIVLDAIYGSTTLFATTYIALLVTDPTDADSGTEVTGSGYARLLVAQNATNWPNASGGLKSNGVDFTFAAATGGWTTGNYIGVYDSLTSGTLLHHGALDAALSISDTDVAVIKAGALDITES